MIPFPIAAQSAVASNAHTPGVTSLECDGTVFVPGARATLGVHLRSRGVQNAMSRTDPTHSTVLANSRQTGGSGGWPQGRCQCERTPKKMRSRSHVAQGQRRMRCCHGARARMFCARMSLLSGAAPKLRSQASPPCHVCARKLGRPAMSALASLATLPQLRSQASRRWELEPWSCPQAAKGSHCLIQTRIERRRERVQD
jgi:hypothetical protein